jgi:lysozyme family protein
MSIATIIEGLIEREGDYTDHPSDKGGPTRWGITEKVARSKGYAGDMRQLPRTFAAAVYTGTYINGPGFDKVLAVSPRIAEEMIDTGVNMGPNLPGAWLQRILNALNRQGKDYADIKVDGDIGPATIAALRGLIVKRGVQGEAAVVIALQCQQGVRYLDITEARPQNEDFYFGWLINRVGML